MSINIIDSIKSSQLLPATIQAIEQQVQPGAKITPQDRQRLVQQLELASQSVEALQEQAKSVRDLAQAQILKNLEGLDDKIKQLHGDIDDRFTDAQVHQIQEEARTLNEHIKQPLVNGNALRISKEVNLLKKHINTLCDNYRLLRTDRVTIAQARSSVRHAEAVLQGTQYIESPVLDVDLEEEEACLMALDLYEIADLFHQRKGKSAISAFNQLPDRVKKRFFFHLQKLDPMLAHPLVDTTKTIQALLAVAGELSHSDEGYMTVEEINTLFNEAHAAS
jgi:hypothetical protein